MQMKNKNDKPMFFFPYIISDIESIRTERKRDIFAPDNMIIASMINEQKIKNFVFFFFLLRNSRVKNTKTVDI